MRSRNSLMRERREAFRDARLIVIASEGKDTLVSNYGFCCIWKMQYR